MKLTIHDIESAMSDAANTEVAFHNFRFDVLAWLKRWEMHGLPCDAADELNVVLNTYPLTGD